MQASNLIYDWNIDPTSKTVRSIQLCDETLRDGLQGNLPRLPSIDEKLDLLTRSEQLGLSEACVGFPAQAVAYQDALALFKRARERRLRLSLGLVGRMVKSDIEAIANIQQTSGHPAIANLAMMGSSPIRRYIENCNLDELERLMRDGVSYATKLGLPTHVSLEDVSRSEPEVIERLFSAAVESGAVFVAINAFMTQAGVHASVILKAEIRGESNIAALVYSPIDPHWVGLDYEIHVGPSSDRSNVQLLLHRKGLNVEERASELILHKACHENRLLAEEEVCALATSFK